MRNRRLEPMYISNDRQNLSMGIHRQEGTRSRIAVRVLSES